MRIKMATSYTIEQIQLKLSDLQYLNSDEITVLCNYLFANSSSQLDFNNILNSLNCRTINNLSIFSCTETKGILQYLQNKLSTSLTFVNKSNSGQVLPQYYTFYSNKQTPFNIDLYVNLIIACYFQYKAEINKLTIYQIKYLNNTCKNDTYNLLDSTISYTNLAIVNNNIDFFNAFYDLSLSYNLPNPFLDLISIFKLLTNRKSKHSTK